VSFPRTCKAEEWLTSKRLPNAVVSFGVVLSGIVTLTTGWQWVDPAVSMAVSLAVLVST
jgi:cobalt-zinc-cadmium efflux system protein